MNVIFKRLNQSSQCCDFFFRVRNSSWLWIHFILHVFQRSRRHHKWNNWICFKIMCNLRHCFWWRRVVSNTTFNRTIYCDCVSRSCRCFNNFTNHGLSVQLLFNRQQIWKTWRKYSTVRNNHVCWIWWNCTHQIWNDVVCGFISNISHIFEFLSNKTIQSHSIMCHLVQFPKRIDPVCKKSYWSLCPKYQFTHSTRWLCLMVWYFQTGSLCSIWLSFFLSDSYCPQYIDFKTHFVCLHYWCRFLIHIFLFFNKNWTTLL